MSVLIILVLLCLLERSVYLELCSWCSYEFLWTDKYKYRKPTRLPAKVYIDYLMNWIVHLIEDVNLFPVEPSILHLFL